MKFLVYAGFALLMTESSFAELTELYSFTSSVDGETQSLEVTFGNLQRSASGETLQTTLFKTRPDLIAIDSGFGFSKFKLERGGVSIFSTKGSVYPNGDFSIRFPLKDLKLISTLNDKRDTFAVRKLRLSGVSAKSLFDILKNDLRAFKHPFYNNSLSLMTIDPAGGSKKNGSNIECFQN
jgi:hypothetical protein